MLFLGEKNKLVSDNPIVSIPLEMIFHFELKTKTFDVGSIFENFFPLNLCYLNSLKDMESLKGFQYF